MKYESRGYVTNKRNIEKFKKSLKNNKSRAGELKPKIQFLEESNEVLREFWEWFINEKGGKEYLKAQLDKGVLWEYLDMEEDDFNEYLEEKEVEYE